MAHDEGAYPRAIKELTTQIQILMWRREALPIRDRDEVRLELAMLLTELDKYMQDGKLKWRKSLLELAAYAIFAAVSDE